MFACVDFCTISENELTKSLGNTRQYNKATADKLKQMSSFTGHFALRQTLNYCRHDCETCGTRYGDVMMNMCFCACICVLCVARNHQQKISLVWIPRKTWNIDVTIMAKNCLELKIDRNCLTFKTSSMPTRVR